MINDIVNYIRNLCLRHKGVRTFRYQSDTSNNQRGNFKPIQCYLDDNMFCQYLITKGIFTCTMDLYVLQPKMQEDKVEDLQSRCLTVGADVLAAIDLWDEYKGVISLYDYSMYTLSDYSDDKCAGVKITIVLQIPSPVNLCTLGDNFNDEPYEDEPEADIDVPERYDPELDDITPITLPKKNACN